MAERAEKAKRTEEKPADREQKEVVENEDLIEALQNIMNELNAQNTTPGDNYKLIMTLARRVAELEEAVFTEEERRDRR